MSDLLRFGKCYNEFVLVLKFLDPGYITYLDTRYCTMFVHTSYVVMKAVQDIYIGIQSQYPHRAFYVRATGRTTSNTLPPLP